MLARSVMEVVGGEGAGLERWKRDLLVGAVWSQDRVMAGSSRRWGHLAGALEGPACK